jgi:hypothetical protein
MNRVDQKAYQQWLDLRTRISAQTAPIQHETRAEQHKRVTTLKKNFAAFCSYYFPHYCQSPFGWFHRRAARAIAKDQNIFAILEWPREHPKSVFADVLIPLWLKARGELTGMMIARH